MDDFCMTADCKKLKENILSLQKHEVKLKN